METQIWSKAEEKWAYVLVLRGTEVHCLKVTGNMLTLKRNLAGVVEALEEGQAPAETKATVVEALDAREIGKAELTPGSSTITLHRDGDAGKNLTYDAGDSNLADSILQTILGRSGKTFQPKQEEIGVGEALIPPIFLGGICELGCLGIYMTASQIAEGHQVEAKGIRRRGLQHMLIWVSELLGQTGAIVLAIVLLVLFAAWAVRRIIKRPERTVWLPDQA